MLSLANNYSEFNNSILYRYFFDAMKNQALVCKIDFAIIKTKEIKNKVRFFKMLNFLVSKRYIVYDTNSNTISVRLTFEGKYRVENFSDW